MADPGDVFRRVFSWLPAPFASQSGQPVGPRRFGSTEHLSTEAIAAFVDGELRMTAYLRAGHHLSLCPLCAGEVDTQRQARSALRDACPIAMPNALLGLLSQIPDRNPEAIAAEDPPQQVAEGAGRARRKRR
jgi:anti-sigma factor RsiW